MLKRFNNKAIYSKRKIRIACRKVAKSIRKDYAGKEVLLLCVLKGACFFFSDLARDIKDIPVMMDFLTVSSYHGNTVQSDIIDIDLSHLMEIRGKHVIIVEDIIDTGNSLKVLIPHLKKLQPASIAVAALVSKEKHPEDLLGVNVYHFFEKGNGFLIGYGMDYKELYRNLPEIYPLRAMELSDA